MRKLLLAIPFLLAWLSPAMAQQPAPPQAYNFRVTADDAKLILNKLSEAPWKDVNVLMQSLINQVNAQNVPPPPPPAAPSPAPVPKE